uniref:NACHT domain-containing protein n=1 Tax=uncultured marine group II/III euryarchaeote KM3_203_B10 TaxID=1457981 RepID=A0A075GUE9_9EURY|nr:hypothetical protein [uncultured marine group II/III euryarchaeote KM3_203_B10]
MKASKDRAVSYRHELPEGIGRKPTYSELGEYGQFVFEPNLLPSLYRVKKGTDLVYFIQKSGHYQGKLTAMDTVQADQLEKLCTPYVRPIVRFQRKISPHIGKIYGGFWLFALGLLGLVIFSYFANIISGMIIGFGSGSAILSGFIIRSAVNHYNSTWKNSNELFTNWEAQENTNPDVNTCQNANTVDIKDWFNTFTEEKIRFNPKQKSMIRLAISHFSKSQRGSGDSVIFPFNGIGGTSRGKLSEEDRYLLARYRIKNLWVAEESLVDQYCTWIGWDDNQIASAKKQDNHLFTGWLVDDLIANAENDIEINLSRLISEAEGKTTYQYQMIDDVLFWLERPVEVGVHTTKFIDWLQRGIEDWNGQILYLISEAAMGKSTTMNLLTIAGCKKQLDTKILPIRIKIRDLENQMEKIGSASDSEIFQTLLSSFDKENKLDEVLQYYSDPANSTTPLIILDGMDEISLENQRILLNNLNRISKPSFPIMVTSRPTRLVSPDIQTSGLHAKLARLSPLQRMKILQNIDMRPDATKSMQKHLSPELIDRPFALMIAAKVLRNSVEKEGVSGLDNDLSVQNICKIYEREFDAREDSKRSGVDNRRSWDQRRSALSEIARHQIGVMCGTINESEEIECDVEIEDDLILRSQLHPNRRLVDTWLEGYYASTAESFEERNWQEILDYSAESGRRSLILRNYCCASPPDETPNWNDLGDYAPEVMNIASEVWKTMNLEKRIALLDRFDIPSNAQGHIEFSDEHHVLLSKCKLSELMALLHFHCSIVDSDEWRQGSRDLQWELMFRTFIERLNEVGDWVGRYQDYLDSENDGDEDSIETDNKEKIESLRETFEFRQPRRFFKPNKSLLEAIFNKGIAEHVKNIIPHHRSSARTNSRSLFCGDAKPASLFQLIDECIRSKSTASNIFFAISMSEQLSKRTLFRMDPSILLESFGQNLTEISNCYIHLLCYLSGCSNYANWKTAQKLGWPVFAPSLVEITANDKSVGPPLPFTKRPNNKWVHHNTIGDAVTMLQIATPSIIYRRISHDYWGGDEESVHGIRLLCTRSPYSSDIDWEQCRNGMLTRVQVIHQGKGFVASISCQDLYNGLGLPEANKTLGFIIEQFEKTESKKFQNQEYYDDISTKLDAISEQSKVIGYLSARKTKTFGKPHRWMYLPGLEKVKIGGLAFEISSPSNQAFRKIFIPHSSPKIQSKSEFQTDLSSLESSRWYAFDVELIQNSSGYWEFVPKPSSIELLCQECLKTTINPEGKKFFSCEDCSLGYMTKEFTSSLKNSYRYLFDKFNRDGLKWNSKHLHSVQIDWGKKEATIFVEEGTKTRYFIGREMVKTPEKAHFARKWLIQGVEKNIAKSDGIERIFVKASKENRDILSEEE